MALTLVIFICEQLNSEFGANLPLAGSYSKSSITMDTRGGGDHNRPASFRVIAVHDVPACE